MNGLRRVSILLGVSLVLTLFLGGMTVLADESGSVSGNSNPEPPVVERRRRHPVNLTGMGHLYPLRPLSLTFAGRTELLQG